MKKLIALLLLSPLAFAVEIQANDSLVDKCRLTYPDSKDVDRFLGCIQGDKPAELSDYHRSQIPDLKTSDLKTSDYETRKIEDICPKTQLVDSVKKIYLVQYSDSHKRDFYRGQLRSDCNRHGQGTYMYSNGTEFVGTYANGIRVSGSEYYPDGGVREGMSFIDNQLHGTTKFYFANGQVNQETWRNGKNIGNVMIQMSPQQVLANQQQAQNNLTRSEKIGNFGRCLAEGTFLSCSDSWNGYTSPPPKKVYKCEYDTFGNRISSTCTEQ